MSKKKMNISKGWREINTSISCYGRSNVSVKYSSRKSLEYSAFGMLPNILFVASLIVIPKIWEINFTCVTHRKEIMDENYKELCCRNMLELFKGNLNDIHDTTVASFCCPTETLIVFLGISINWRYNSVKTMYISHTIRNSNMYDVVIIVWNCNC